MQKMFTFKVSMRININYLKAKKSPITLQLSGVNKTLATTYSPTLSCAVPSAMEGLTSEFGMGSGVPPPLMSPRKIFSIWLIPELSGLLS